MYDFTEEVALGARSGHIAVGGTSDGVVMGDPHLHASKLVFVVDTESHGDWAEGVVGRADDQGGSPVVVKHVENDVVGPQSFRGWVIGLTVGAAERSILKVSDGPLG